MTNHSLSALYPKKSRSVVRYPLAFQKIVKSYRHLIMLFALLNIIIFKLVGFSANNSLGKWLSPFL